MNKQKGEQTMQISGKDAARLFGAAMGMDSAKVEKIISDADNDEPVNKYEVLFYGRPIDPETGKLGDKEIFTESCGYKTYEEAEQEALKTLESIEGGLYPDYKYSHYKISKY